MVAPSSWIRPATPVRKAWAATGHPLASLGLVPAAAVHGSVVDVRQATEYETGHLPGATHAELGALTAADLPSGDVTVMCGHGERAMTAASIHSRQGRRDVTVAIGGPGDWAAGTGGQLVASA